MNVEPTTITLGIAGLAGLIAGAAIARLGPRLKAKARDRAQARDGSGWHSTQEGDGKAEPGHGLLPRAQFEFELEDRMLRAEKSGRDTCVLHIAVDGLRRSLAGLAPEFCEAALFATAMRLRAVCGATTPMSRVAEEEYALWLDAPREAAEKLAVRLTEDFAAPLVVQVQSFELSLSVGVAVSPEHGSGLRLLKKAVAATRAVQRHGGGAHAVFDPRIGAEHNDELSLAKDLQEALRRHQLELFYQPKIDARQFDVDAVEGLLRWRHPTRGLVSPGRIIEVAERQGLMEPLGQWILNTLVKTGAAWRAAGLGVNVALNLSGVQFRADDLATQLQRAFKEHGLPSGAMVCEIPEAVAMEGTKATRRAFAQLRALGVRIAISDFKGSAAGLAALSNLPVQEVKISRDLVALLASDAQAQHVVQQIVTTAHERQMSVVAEGIETEAQRNQAMRLECDQLQGYLFVRPMSARAVSIWAADAKVNLAQTLPPSQFKDTLPAPMAQAAELFATTDVMGPR